MCASLEAARKVGVMTTQEGTKLRLLESSGEIFAARGFREATVREICQRAEANVSAVKYHFGDKAGLYVATLEYTFACTAERYPLSAADDETLPPVERLRTFIRMFMRRLLDPGRPAWHSRLLVRELIEPTTGFDVIANGIQRNVVERLTGIVRGLLGPHASAGRVRDVVYSITGQCTFYGHARHYLARFEPRSLRTTQAIERVADHIFNFTVGALRSEGASVGRTRKHTHSSRDAKG